MKNFLKENWSRTHILILAALIIGGSFYWFQWRPMEIKKGCSWIEKHTEAIPEVTQADIDQAKIDFPNCEKTHPKSAGLLFQSITCWKLETLATGSPHPAIPSKTYSVAATPEQYSFCLHSHGL